MKKIVLFLMTLLFITACSKNEFTPMTQEEMITQSYNEAFIKTFGQPAANQDWGFETIGIVASTRTAQPNSNQWGTHDDNDKYLDWPKPADITDDERAAVLDVFNKKGKETYTDLLNLTDFFVQQVYCGPNGEKMNQLACWNPQGHEVTEYPEWNGWQAYTYTSNDDEINNFNGGKYSGNELQGCMLMWNSSTSQWSFKTSQSGGERIYDHWRMEYIPGYGYYVGLDHEAWRQAPANANEEDKRDYIYNDWIVKIVPGKGYSKPTPDIRIIAEDLSAKEGSDFDFNDVVFDVTFTSDNTADITLIAAGGTLPLTVAGQEVHKKFGVNTDVMVNTGAGPTKDHVTFSIGGINRSQNGKDIEIAVEKNGEVFVLTAQKGVPASKIGVPHTFDYCSERQDISKKYPLFSTWVQNGPNVVWWEP